MDVSWTLDCASGKTGGSTFKGSFEKTFFKASGCAATIDAGLNTEAGTIHVWIYER